MSATHAGLPDTYGLLMEQGNEHGLGGTALQAYRAGIAGNPCPRFIPKNGSAAHQAWRAGRDTASAAFAKVEP
jgi:hypothetical protein